MSRHPLSPPLRLASHELPPSPSSRLLPSLPSYYDLSPPCSCLTSSFRAALVAASSLLAGGLSSSLLVTVSLDGDIALTYGVVARECIRHQCVARHVLGSDHMKKFFDYIQLSNFEIASDALSTFKELSTRHKSTVSEFLSKNYDWFFEEYNTRLLESNSYFTRRLAIKLLADMLLDRSNSSTMVRYVAEYYSPRAKERWCLSLYNNVGHHALGVFP
ncbi:Putative MO25-like protein [Arachis hypogaea]|uniref:MO25-like protein n=1 Tax=Arachis hypogaea TaxID=3818 RepID=A0A445EB72_ARAHY|nr:Putative MO25-like protein [Arachis hypogaea]RYR72742.1 hypothetical protein Ahy_A02g006957 [Arachis hypogaea]